MRPFREFHWQYWLPLLKQVWPAFFFVGRRFIFPFPIVTVATIIRTLMAQPIIKTTLGALSTPLPVEMSIRSKEIRTTLVGICIQMDP